MHLHQFVCYINRINAGVIGSAQSTLIGLRNKDARASFYGKCIDHSITQELSWIEYERKKIKGGIESDSIIITHGLWLWPSREGYYWKKKGVKWVVFPHGMLDKWALKHKGLKKYLYWYLFEKKMLNKANAIVALSRSEYNTLTKYFSNVKLIPNGIAPVERKLTKANDSIKFVFMGRLHKKKGVLPLVEAWCGSALLNQSNVDLLIIGPDEGELNVLQPLISESPNIRYIGPKYGDEKEELLASAHFFVLPSYSEGFPMSVLEAMTHGCIPILTDGCNFPEAFENNVALRTTVNPVDITKSLEKAAAMSNEEISELSRRAKSFVDENYNIEKIAQLQYDLYANVLGEA